MPTSAKKTIFRQGMDPTRYWNRDVNSTLNMLKCVYYMKNNNGSRPPYMTRPTTIVSLGASCSSGGVSASDHTVPQSIYSGK